MSEVSDQSYLWPILGAVAGGIGSFFIGLLMERYKNRRVELTNSISFQKIGLPTDSYLPGELAVNYNGNQVNSLYLFRLIIKNTSNVDADNLPVNVFTDLDSYILSYSCPWTPNTAILTESPSYTERVKDYIEKALPILDEKPNEILSEPLNSEGKWLHRNRELISSALNRKEEIELTILAGSQVKDHQPYLYLKIPKSQVVLVDATDPIKENERLAKICFLAGIALTIGLGIYFTLPFREESGHFIILSIVGALNFFIALAVYKIISFIHSYFR